MKNTLLVGRAQADEGSFLVLMQSKDLLRDNYIYQLKKISGVGINIRPLDPYIKNTVKTSEVLNVADEIITLQKPDADIQEILTGHEYTPLDKYAEPHVETKIKHNICLSYNKYYLPDALKLVTILLKLGYSFELGSTNDNLNRLMALTRCYAISDADFKLILNVDDKEIDIDEIWKILLNKARKTITRKSYAKRLLKRFQLEQFGRNIFRLTKNEVYLTMSRQTVKLTSTQNHFLHWLETGNNLDKVPHVSRHDMETVIYMLLNEHFYAERVDSLLPTNLVKIDNINDMIISFLGSRRCNLGCKYCFSNHSCAALSKMKTEEVLDICDMLTDGQENIQVHFDNGLGGEPTLDFDKVQARHLATLAWHKNRGINASFGLLTNGTTLKKNPHYLQWLKTHLPYIGFSLDGDRNTNDRIRRDANGNPTYERVVNGIRTLQDMQWPVEVGISGVITKYNTNIRALQKHAHKLGIHNLVMKPVRAAEKSDFALTYDNMPRLTKAYQKFFDYLMKEATNNNFEPLFTSLQPLDYVGRFLLRTFYHDRLIVKRCGSGEIIYSVSDDGKIWPCDSFNGVNNRELGNLQDGLHNRDKYHVPFVTEEKFGCNKCWARYLCGGVCNYVKHLNDQRQNNVIRQECALSKFLITTSLRFWHRARKLWSNDCLAKLSSHIQHIGVEPLKNGALVYAPC